MVQKKNKKNSSNVNSFKKEHEHAKNAFCALLSEKNNNNTSEWYIDSGASSHMTPNDKLLSNIKNVGVKNIITANNTKMPVKCIGEATLKLEKEEIQVNDVMHVPDLVANLLSVYKILENNNTVVFQYK